MRSAHRLVVGVVLLLITAMSTMSVRVGETEARLSGSVSGPTHSFSGARFVPTVTPVPTPSNEPAGVVLHWMPTTLTSGESVSYTVTRRGSDGTVTPVCTGAASPVQILGVMTCTDASLIVDVTYRYAVQPIAVRNGVHTWSSLLSAQSTSVLGPRLVFASIGPVATSTTTSPITVQYPAGTVAGDVLLLVERSARVANIVAPSGWTELVSTKVGYTQSTLFLAWRVADAATSTSFQPKANSEGSATWIVRYRRTIGNTFTPNYASAAVASEAANASATFGTSTPLVTNTNNSTVISLATILATNVLSLGTPNFFAVRDTTTATSSVGSFSLGVADTQGVANATSTTGPIWSQSGLPGAWHLVTVAFS